ncbi:DUF4892 domain-containing protein [Halopseudomonas sp.]|uniref:DUF4892 domain-containing protein n=1 Tax=Halopseudomonas sp. TaxID=2901191 RepID=UPI001A433FB7|nr:DUF4892 domain-containing protein [Pseudomonas sp.]|tara:strand:- start:51879 stop:52715 length:837 start_codon:yes stop_codon:yes gene_type:complete
MSFSQLISGVRIGLLLAAPAAMAAPVPEQLEFEPFPGSRVTQSEVLTEADHSFVIGLVRKVNNRLRAEREVVATGELVRVTFEIPRHHSRVEAFDHAREQLLAQPHTMLFFCEGRECGSSALWANEVLDNARLYGPDDNQVYLALSLDQQPQQLVSVYAVTRGNRRVYLHIDQFTPDEPIDEALYPTPSTLLKILENNGSLALPALGVPAGSGPVVGDPEVWVNLVNRMLRSDTQIRVAINGAEAPAIRQRLLDLGIRASRLEVGQPVPESGVVLERL